MYKCKYSYRLWYTVYVYMTVCQENKCINVNIPTDCGTLFTYT